MIPKNNSVKIPAAKISENQALAIKQELMALCKKYGLWVNAEEVHKPELKDIVLTVSMRITKTP